MNTFDMAYLRYVIDCHIATTAVIGSRGWRQKGIYARFLIGSSHDNAQLRYWVAF